MTQSAVVFTEEKSSSKAGEALGNQMLDELAGNKPDVVILFASSIYEYVPLLKALNQKCRPEVLVGCSSAGEFTGIHFGTNAACAVGIRSSGIRFRAGLGREIKKNRAQAVEQMFGSLKGMGNYEYPYHAGLLLADALSGYTDELIDLLTVKTGGTYQFFGGGAGDNANFEKTYVFCGEEAVTDAAVILEILSTKPLGIGVRHGWKPASEKMRVTAAEGMRLISINATPAVEIFTEYASATQQTFDLENPVPFFLHNVLGIALENGYKLRVPLSVQPDGSILCASDIPEGATIAFMGIEPAAAGQAALDATGVALQKLNGNKPNVALFFDCVATRLRMGKDFGFELDHVKNALKATNYVGCNTYGQVARVDGQFSGFHNCTAVVCVIPE